MKTFKDIKCGDCIYIYDQFNNTIDKLKITQITKNPIITEFHFGDGVLDHINILNCCLCESETFNAFSDIDALFDYINEKFY